MGRTYRGSAEIRFRGEGKEKKPSGEIARRVLGQATFLRLSRMAVQTLITSRLFS